jgi:endoglucanase
MTRGIHRIVRGVVVGVAWVLGATGIASAQDFGPAVKVNQVAYVPGLPKMATVVNGATSSLAWTVRNAGGSWWRLSGQTTVRGLDANSGDNVHIVDFSTLDTAANGYVLSVGGVNSLPFDISADPIRRLRYDALAFFYHQRSSSRPDCSNSSAISTRAPRPI